MALGNESFANVDLSFLSFIMFIAGSGDVQNGKGVYGLQRAIRVAGAESLIMSMWEVDDKATQDSQSKAVVSQNLNKGGDTITNTTKGGDSTTINVLKGGNNSLGNGHIPVPQAV